MSAEGAAEIAASFAAKARTDYEVLKRLITAGPELEDAIGFHGQQAIEKAIKAVMVARSVRIIRTHKLRRLVDICGSAGINVPATQTDLDALSAYAVEWRYLERNMPKTPLDREELTADVETILAWAAREISA